MKFADFVQQFEPKEGWDMDIGETVEDAIASDVRDTICSAGEYWGDYGYAIDEMMENNQFQAESYITGDESVRVSGRFKVTVTVEAID